jgi:SAM-dependent methyltransferase
VNTRKASNDSFRRYDETDDELFYKDARKVVHIDDGAIGAVSQLYGELLPNDGYILDLMTAWRSHLPANYHAQRVTGLGMNAEEMRDNPQLTDFVVHNLNKTPRLPFEDQTFDGVICTVSVQYLTNPSAVFKDLYRILKSGAPAIFTFSDRCFPTKAVTIWQSSSMKQKVQYIATHFFEAGFASIHAEDRSPKPKRSLFGGSSGDPLIGVWAYRPSVEG